MSTGRKYGKKKWEYEFKQRSRLRVYLGVLP
jgi:hypothetical protein